MNKFLKLTRYLNGEVLYISIAHIVSINSEYLSETPRGVTVVRTTGDCWYVLEDIKTVVDNLPI